MFYPQPHLPNQFVPTLLVTSPSRLPVAHVYGATCDITCWSGSYTNPLCGEGGKGSAHLQFPPEPLQLLPGRNMGVVMGEERVLGILGNHRLNLASCRQAHCSGHLPVWCMVSRTASPCLCLRLPGAVWLGLCGPESKQMSSIKDRLCWTSLKPAFPELLLFFSPLTETELNSSLSGFLPCTAYSTTGAPNQLCPAHFSRDFVHIPQMSASWS